MKLVQKIGVLSIGALLACGTSADTLYWQIAPEANKAFDYATLYAIEEGSSNGQYVDFANSLGGSPSSTGIHGSDISGYNNSTWSFYVELTRGSDVVYTGKTFSYTDLYNNGYIATSFNSNESIAALQRSNFSIVPEPTSGLLLLMGGAMLALRRRRRV